MSLALIVYLVGVIPALGNSLSFIGVLMATFLGAASIITYAMSNETYVWSWEDEEQNLEKRKRLSKLSPKLFYGAVAGLVMAFLSVFIPNKETMLLMVSAYGVETLASNEKVQEIGKDGLDVIQAYLAKAKKELEQPVK